MRAIRAWLQASRLPSQSYIFLPLLMGQALQVSDGGRLDGWIVVLVHLFGLCDQLFIVYANDYADQATDRLNRTFTPLSGGSRVLVQGQLSPHSLRRAALLMAAFALSCALLLALIFGRWMQLPLVLLGLLLLWAYSYPPLRLSYRGGGSWLQMIGVGGLLPLIGYQAQAGTLAHFPWALFLGLLPTHLAAAMATALPDEPSDRTSDKRTFVVVHGQRAAQAAILMLNLGALAALLIWSSALFRGVALIMPLASWGGALALFGGKPGTRRLLAFVVLTVLFTLSVVGAIAASAMLAG
jgi:1,4-dihydroxy-2-naphthoate octaprenyltransferase